MVVSIVAFPPLDRSAVAIGLEAGLRPRFRAIADGRTLAIGYFASNLCGRNIVIGDLALDWLEDEPGGSVRLPAGYVALEPLEGVGLAADDRLLGLLAAAGPTLVPSGTPFGLGPGLALRLDDATAWIDFLESPAARTRARPD